MAKKFFDPKTGKATTQAVLQKKLMKEETRLFTFKTGMGAFAQAMVVAAYKNALGIDPVPYEHARGKTFYNGIPLWETAKFENGVPTIDFGQGERQVWDEVYADNEVAFLMHKGADILAVRPTSDDGLKEKGDAAHLTEREFQFWVDLLGAAPKLLELAKELRAQSVILPCDLTVLLDKCLKEAYQNTKDKK